MIELTKDSQRVCGHVFYSWLIEIAVLHLHQPAVSLGTVHNIHCRLATLAAGRFGPHLEQQVMKLKTLVTAAGHHAAHAGWTAVCMECQQTLMVPVASIASYSSPWWNDCQDHAGPSRAESSPPDSPAQVQSPAVLEARLHDSAA